MPTHYPAPSNDVAACVRAFVAACVIGAEPRAESYAEAYFAYRDPLVAERLIGLVLDALEGLRDAEAARALGIPDAHWAVYQAMGLADS